jgi:hypothetical protein
MDRDNNVYEYRRSMGVPITVLEACSGPKVLSPHLSRR